MITDHLGDCDALYLLIVSLIIERYLFTNLLLLFYFQMNRPIQVKPADSESRAGECVHYFVYSKFHH